MQIATGKSLPESATGLASRLLWLSVSQTLTQKPASMSSSEDELDEELVDCIAREAGELSPAAFEKVMLAYFPLQSTAAAPKGRSRKKVHHNLTLQEARDGWDDTQWGDLLDNALDRPNEVRVNTLSLIKRYKFPVGGALVIFCDKEPKAEEEAAMEADEIAAANTAIHASSPSLPSSSFSSSVAASSSSAPVAASAVSRPYERMFMILLAETTDKAVLREAYLKMAAGCFRTQGQKLFKAWKQASFNEQVSFLDDIHQQQ